MHPSLRTPPLSPSPSEPLPGVCRAQNQGEGGGDVPGQRWRGGSVTGGERLWKAPLGADGLRGQMRICTTPGQNIETLAVDNCNADGCSTKIWVGIPPPPPCPPPLHVPACVPTIQDEDAVSLPALLVVHAPLCLFLCPPCPCVCVCVSDLFCMGFACMRV